MSSQRGNINRSRAQKHKNSSVFKNDKYDKSKRTQLINTIEVAEVCKRCQEVIAWKVKYKKYKLLSQPKTCTKCHQRKIKDSYHVVCLDCAKELGICCKCGKNEDIVAHKSPSERERIQTMAQLEVEVKALSERKRRAYYRHIGKLKGKKKKKKTSISETSSQAEKESHDSKDHKEEKEETELSLDEYFKNARQKLEELQKKMDDDVLDDFDDLDICGSSSDEFFEADEGNDCESDSEESDN